MQLIKKKKTKIKGNNTEENSWGLILLGFYGKKKRKKEFQISWSDSVNVNLEFKEWAY